MCIEATKSDTPEIVDKLYCDTVHAYNLYIVDLTFESMEATEQYFPLVLFIKVYNGHTLGFHPG